MKGFAYTIAIWFVIFSTAISAADIDSWNGLNVQIPASQIIENIYKLKKQLPTFTKLAEIAAKHKARIWILGGGAAGLAQYVKWKIAKERGDSRFDLWNSEQSLPSILRSTQDLDLVVDLPPSAAEALHQEINFTFPSLSIELRTLHGTLRNRVGILETDFIDQNSDSMSLGLIELTEPPRGESTLRSAHEWHQQGENIFLKDLTNDQITLIDNPNHFTTQRAREQNNPVIFSAIRYLIKAFQFGLSIPPESRVKIEAIVQDFDSNKDLQTSYARFWINRHAKKLAHHSINLERTWNILNQLGLREKLLKIGQISDQNDLAFWMNKEPLPSFPLNSGLGRTARELKINEVTHETSDLWIYESILGSPVGEVNAFISRPDVAGESAALGRGFYVYSGTEIFHKTWGIVTRFKLHPYARQGTDFEMRANDGRIRILNARALIPQRSDADFGPDNFIKNIISGWTPDLKDRAVLALYRQHLKHATEDEITRIFQFCVNNRYALKNSARVAILYNFILAADSRKIWGDLLEEPLKTAHPQIKKEALYRLSKEIIFGASIENKVLRLLVKTPAEYFSLITHTDKSLNDLQHRKMDDFIEGSISVFNDLSPTNDDWNKLADKTSHFSADEKIYTFLESQGRFEPAEKNYAFKFSLSPNAVTADKNLKLAASFFSNSVAFRKWALRNSRSLGFYANGALAKWVLPHYQKNSQLISFENLLEIARLASESQVNLDYHQLLIRKAKTPADYLSAVSPRPLQEDYYYRNLGQLIVKTYPHFLTLRPFPEDISELIRLIPNTSSVVSIQKILLSRAKNATAWIDALNPHLPTVSEEHRAQLSEIVLNQWAYFLTLSPARVDFETLLTQGPHYLAIDAMIEIRRRLLKVNGSLDELYELFKLDATATYEYKLALDQLLVKVLPQFLPKIKTSSEVRRILSLLSNPDPLKTAHQLLIDRTESPEEMIELLKPSHKNPSYNYRFALDQLVHENFENFLKKKPTTAMVLKYESLKLSIANSLLFRRRAALLAKDKSDFDLALTPHSQASDHDRNKLSSLREELIEHRDKLPEPTFKKACINILRNLFTL